MSSVAVRSSPALAHEPAHCPADVLDQQAQDQTEQWTRALVLNVHQLVTALRMPAGDAMSIGAASFGSAGGMGAAPTVQAMMAAQEAMQGTLGVSETRGRRHAPLHAPISCQQPHAGASQLSAAWAHVQLC